MMLGDVLVGDDRDLAPGRSAAIRSPSVGEQAAADHDVVGALAERDVDRDRIAGAQRRGHGWLAARHASAPAPAAATVRSAAMISSTIVSCGTSRDSTVMSASA